MLGLISPLSFWSFQCINTSDDRGVFFASGSVVLSLDSLNDFINDFIQRAAGKRDRIDTCLLEGMRAQDFVGLQ